MPIDILRKDGHVLVGYFSNSNIHPYSEYLKREAEVGKYAKEVEMNVFYGDWDLNAYFQNIIYNESPRDRCPICWWMRLFEAARFAKENGFEAFSTTLLGSPYQDHDAIISIGNDIAKNCGLVFHAADFRPTFREGQERARKMGMYLQNYCGCLYSEMERIEKKGQGARVKKKKEPCDRGHDHD